MAERLPKELIENPRIWRLYLEIKPDAIESVMYATMGDQALMHYRLPFDHTASSQLAAIEETVYENPLLLSDFGKSSVLIDTPRFMLVPEAFESNDAIAAMVRRFWNDDTLSVLVNTLPSTGMKIALAIEPGLHSFLQRTFPGIRINHPLWALVTYFYNKDRLTNASKMYVHVRDGHIDVIYFGDGVLKLANTFDVSNTDDMVYYVLMCAEALGIDLKDDEVMLCGAPPVREKLATELRKYVRYVMPVIFPSVMYHSGKDALESPFELIVLPLCE